MPIPMWRRVLSLFLSAILVFQNLTCWMTPAWAEEMTSPGTVVAAAQVDAAEGAGQPAAADGQDAADALEPSGDDASNGAGDADNADANDAAGSDANAGSANVSSDAASSQQTPQASSNPAALASEEASGSEDGTVSPRAYNPNAPHIAIDDFTSYGMEVKITYDGERAWQGEAITPDTEMYGEIKGGINEGVLTPETPRLHYVFPSNITVPNIGDTDLYDESGAYKATWSISNGVFYITYAEEWLQKHPSGITLGINFKMKLNPDAGNDADKVEIKFPGVSSIVTFPLKDGNVTGTKWGTVDAESSAVTWTVQLDVASKASNVVLTDTIGSNLTFDGATFKLDGNDLATAPTVNGQTATLNLGNLSQGRHTLTYTTPISPDAWKTVANGGQLSGVDNAASWTWGSNGENNKNNVSPTGPQLSINMAGKQGAGTSDDITWTASINTGSLKADMAGYVFTDTLGAGHAYKGSYEVKDASGATVATGALPTDGSSFSYTFGADAGKQAYTIVYHTQMTDTASKDPVNNKFTIENPNGEGPKGDASSSFIPADDTQYITKKLVSSETAAADGYATWESTIFMSRMSANTDPTKVTFTDEFNASQYQRTTFDQLKLTAGDYQLVEGVDYKVTNDGQWNKLEFTFMASDAVRALIGSTNVTVTYRTKCDGSNDTYTNKSTLRTPTVAQSAEASFTIKADKTPEVAKNGNMYWDANFDWSKVEAGSTERGAWVSNWTVLVNQVQPNGWTTAPAGPLGGVDVIVTDDMPENMVYVPGSSRYYLHGSDNSTIGHWPTLTAEPACEGSTAVFTVKTDVEGVKADVNYYVELQYQTAVHSSALGSSGAAVQFTNKAYAQAGTQTFPAGFKTVEAANEIMKKSAEQVPNSSYIKYTISVNKNAVDLVPGSDTLTLVDTMDSKCTYLPATLHVYYQGTTTEVPGCSTLTENVTLDNGARATRLTLTIPDSCAIDVVYQVQPAGNPGDQVSLTNSAEISGVANSATSHQKQWTVVKAGATTEGTGYGIIVTKSDASNAKKVLGGATFELYQVAWDGAETLIGTQVSNDNGVVQFGSKETPLLACTLYYFVETQAPAGYQCSADKTYFMFKGTYSQEQYQEALNKAKAIGIAEPSPATSFNITNKKNDTLVVTGEFQLNLAKTVNGLAPKAGETFEFSATAEGDNAADAPAFENVATAEDGTAAFATAKLSDKDAGKTYTYRIHEVTEAAQGWTNAPDVIATVTVGVATDAGLSADVSYKLDAAGAEAYVGAAHFDNAYQAKPARATLAVDKTVNGEKIEGLTRQFTFALTDEYGEQVGDEVAVEGTGTAEFGELTFDAPGTYRYTVHETSARGAGWTNAPDVKVAVTVDYAGNGRDLEVKAIEYENGTGAAAFDNTYVATGEAVISVSKTVNGGTEVGQGESFTFGLYEADEQGNRIGEPFAYASTMVGGAASFDPISYNVDAAGKTFTYVVHEIGHNANGWTAAPDVAVTVSVGDNGDGALKCDVSYPNGGDTAAFDNAYVAATGEFQLELAKTVNGETPKAGETFEFGAICADEGAPVLPDVMTDESGRATFAAAQLSGKDAGKTYTYTIHELTEAGEGWTNAPDVIATVKVAAERDAQGILAAEVAYSTGTDIAQFDNAYQAKPARATLAVDKTVNGEKIEGLTRQFTFALADEYGEQVGDEIAVEGTGTAEFGELVFDAPGTHRYTVHETSAQGAGWTNAADVEAAVSVGYAENGRDLEVKAIEYANGTDAAAFDNTYVATGSATLSVAKTVNGEAPGDDQGFDFELRAVTEGAPMPEADVATTVGSARASFSQIEFGLADAGKTYEYLIHETTPATVGWTMAGDVTATVTVGADNGDGTLAPCAVTYSVATQDSQAALFNNMYKQVSGEFQLSLVKTVNGAAPKAGETFEFSATSTDEGAPAFENVTTGEDGSAAFAVAKLSDKDMGKTYTYTIHEVTELTEGAGTWTKAADVTATVVVSERSDDNTLTATVSYSDGSATAAKFDNAYEAQKATATVKVDKMVNGAKDAEENAQFTFALLDKNNEQVGDEITVNGTGTAEFGELVFDAPGTYEYTVHETSDLGDGWFNAGDVKVTVTVDYAENGRDLVAKVTYDGSSADAAQFDNVHAAPATADLKVTKTVNGGPLQPHEQFTFTLLDKDGKQLGDEITIKGSDAKPEAVFDQLTFDKVGTYEFTIHETSDLGDGWTNDGDVKVTVTVTRDEATKTLKAEVVYDRSDIDGSAAKFDNKHVACGSADIAVAKLVNGAAPAADQKFDFALSANDDASAAKMPAQTTATTVGAVAASFGSVDFTLADAGKTFSYTIHETTPAAEGWTNAPDVTVTLTVGDDNDGDGKLPVTVEYSTATADGTAALFNNAYKPVVSEKPSVPKTGDETPVEAMALTAAAGATLAATGLFLGLRSRKRNEQL